MVGQSESKRFWGKQYYLKRNEIMDPINHHNKICILTGFTIRVIKAAM
jgi:hypothetical protein